MGALTNHFDRLLDAARLCPGRRFVKHLQGGARLGACLDGSRFVATLARQHAPVGDVEERTFLKHCAIPGYAVRDPAEGQALVGEWYYVLFAWPDGGVPELGAELPGVEEVPL